MSEEAQGNDKAAPLREPLRRFDSVLNFARKLVRDSGEIPPGLVEDFTQARKELEKQFVLHFQVLHEDLQKQLRELIKVTRNLKASQIAANADKLSQRARSALNKLMIEGEGELSLTSEVGDVRFTDSEVAADKPQFEPSPAAAFVPPQDQSESETKPGVGMRRALVAVVLIGVLAAVALGVGYIVGPWSNSVAPYNADNAVAGTNEPGPPVNEPPSNKEVAPDPEPFDAEAAGYVVKIRARELPNSINPLDTKPDTLIPDDLTGLLMGLEELVATVEPDRLAFPPEDTRGRVSRFAEGAEAAAPDWIKARKPLIEAFIEHVKEQLQLAMYPPQTSGEKVLLSDVLYSLGGGQFSLVVTLGVLSQGCDAPLRLIAPHGPARPLLAIHLDTGVHTYNGETFGLRDGNQPVLLLGEMMVELATSLRLTMDTPEGRLLCSAILQHYETLFTVEQARHALADFDLAWLIPPGEEAEARELLLHDLAKRLQGPVCDTLMKPISNGDADEALAVFRMAQAAGDEERASQALLLLGERAERGALLDGEPLALVVGDLLLEQKKLTEADNWFRRAMVDHPEDPRPVMRLLPRAEGEGRGKLLREAYARGERTLGFMRLIAQSVAKEGDGLAALALFDQVLERDDFEVHDIEQAVLQCLSLGRTDWALERLHEYEEYVAGNASLQRLELICELSANGLTERADTLARTLEEQGELDPFVKSLLERYGG